MIKVYFDAQIFMLQSRGGISRYFSELISEFISNPAHGVSPILAFRDSNNLHAAELLGTGALAHRASKVSRVLDLYSSALLLRRPQTADLIHHTFYSRPFLRSWGIKRVITLYDMIPEKFPRPLNPHLSKRHFVSNCDGILSISNTSWRELREIYDLKEITFPVVTTHLGVNQKFSPSAAPKQRDSKPYLLFVGQRAGYKRADLCIEMLSRLKQREIDLLFVGPEPPARDELDKVAQLNLQDRVRYLSADEDDLPRIYAGAIALLFPNLHEGFGFPPLEAMRCGTPVIAASNDINREVSGNHATYFRADDVAQFAAAVEALLDNSGGEQASRLEAARLHAEKFTWESCAAQTAKFYREVLGTIG